MMKGGCVAAALVLAATGATAAEPGTAPVPAVVVALGGCWEGRGEVMGKPVTIAITARPIVHDAMLALEAESVAAGDPKDVYAAHLLFGGTGKGSGAAAAITGYWSDSFGGGFTATGQGESRGEGFDMTYRYADHASVNRWRPAGDRLTWQIVMRDARGAEKPFAAYALRRKACPPAPTTR